MNSLKEGVDYYTDEQGYLVFTEAYHLRRGSCCGQGCRHCPYPKKPGMEGLENSREGAKDEPGSQNG